VDIQHSVVEAARVACVGHAESLVRLFLPTIMRQTFVVLRALVCCNAACLFAYH
jgi:hypothetical protein